MCDGPGDLGRLLMRGTTNLRRESPFCTDDGEHTTGYTKGWQTALDRVELMLQAWVPEAPDSTGWATRQEQDVEADPGGVA